MFILKKDMIDKQTCMVVLWKGWLPVMQHLVWFFLLFRTQPWGWFWNKCRAILRSVILFRMSWWLTILLVFKTTLGWQIPKMIECMSKENSNHHMGMLILIYRSCRLIIYNWKEKIFRTLSVWLCNGFLRIFTVVRDVILG